MGPVLGLVLCALCSVHPEDAEIIAGLSDSGMGDVLCRTGSSGAEDDADAGEQGGGEGQGEGLQEGVADAVDG